MKTRTPVLVAAAVTAVLTVTLAGCSTDPVPTSTTAGSRARLARIGVSSLPGCCPARQAVASVVTATWVASFALTLGSLSGAPQSTGSLVSWIIAQRVVASSVAVGEHKASGTGWHSGIEGIDAGTGTNVVLVELSAGTCDTVSPGGVEVSSCAFG